MHHLLFGIFLAFFLFVSQPAFPCAMHPPELRSPYKELIQRTNHIVLAQLFKVEDLGKGRFLYSFKTLRRIKGPMKDVINLTSYTSGVELSENHFNHHRDKSFWKQRGRMTPSVDCKIHPQFTKGNQYLLFLDQPYHVKGFERIASENDKWLTEVIKEVGGE